MTEQRKINIGDRVILKEAVITRQYGRKYVYELKFIDGDQACLKRLRRVDGEPLYEAGPPLSICRLKDLALCAG